MLVKDNFPLKFVRKLRKETLWILSFQAFYVLAEKQLFGK